jgi:hypothetical protein
MKTLRFEGYSDDTFGEYAVTRDDYDNCASGEPVEFLITAPSLPEAGMVVTGQHCPARLFQPGPRGRRAGRLRSALLAA